MPLAQGGVVAMQRALVTGRLRLVPARIDDAPRLWRVWREPAVREFLFDGREVSLDLATDVLADCLPHAAQGLGLWLLLPRTRDAADDGASAAEPADALLGCAGLLPVSGMLPHAPDLAGKVEPLVALAPGAWARGYAREALAALVDHAFDDLGLDELAGVTDVPNVRSDAMLRGAGFVPVRECRGPVHEARIYRLRATERPVREDARGA